MADATQVIPSAFRSRASDDLDDMAGQAEGPAREEKQLSKDYDVIFLKKMEVPGVDPQSTPASRGNAPAWGGNAPVSRGNNLIGWLS